MNEPGPKRPALGNRQILQRVVTLVLAIGAGTAVGLIVQASLGSSWGFLAIPIAVAAGWLWWADPSQCTPTPRPIPRDE